MGDLPPSDYQCGVAHEAQQLIDELLIFGGSNRLEVAGLVGLEALFQRVGTCRDVHPLQHFHQCVTTFGGHHVLLKRLGLRGLGGRVSGLGLFLRLFVGTGLRGCDDTFHD
ncbi:hypothetical protein D9M68_718550 [compost metagenome]